MPRAGMLWRHVIINTKCTWLHGDPRGFRSRKHRIHSSGDYKSPPPEGEHARLHRYQKKRASKEVTIPRELRPIIGRVLLAHLLSGGHRVLALAVAKVHAHGVVELPAQRVEVARIVGDAKRWSSRAIEKQLPGSIWAEGGTYKIIETRGHLRKAVDYDLYDQGPGAWTWSYQDPDHEGRFARERPRSGAARR